MSSTDHHGRRSENAGAHAPTDPARKSENVAARMGRWSASHWKTATIGWLAFVAVAFALGGAIGTTTVDPNTTGPGESGRMDRILDAGFPRPAGESVLVQSDTLRVGDPAFTAALEDVVAGISDLDVAQNVRSPLDPANASQVAESGRAALVEFEVRGDRDDAVDRIDPVLERVAEIQAAHPRLFVGIFGDASAVAALETAYADDLEKAGLLSLPITLIVLVVAFGALVAAGIPLLLALTAVFATFGLIAVPSALLPVAMQAPALVLLIGLAVGVDYSMFYLKREREERAAGRSERAALEAAAATSGHSVLVAGLTVMVAMAGMFLTGDAIFASLGFATILVVAIAVLGSLTVLPALLSRLGDNVDRGRVPLVGRLRRDDGESRFWGVIVDRVLRRPVLSAVLAAGVLLALAAPALQLKLVTPGPDTFPKSLPAVEAYDRMQEAFPGTALPASVVVQAADVDAPAVREAIDRLEELALASGRMYEPITVDVSEDATVANVTIPIAGSGSDADSVAAVGVLRDEIVPETVGALPRVEAGVTGLSAQWKDQTDEMKSTLPLVFAFVLAFAFVLVLVAFRSLVVAAKTIALNLLSVAAAYGVLVIVFQHGLAKDLLGFGSTAGIDPVVPLLLFVILFGLSMDYHVLVVGRIRETFAGGTSMDDAISEGVKRTAGVITSAAVVMVGVFSVFAALSMLFFKQFGVGLATAILIDATIVRAVLLPATMKLLGDWNWYLPKWLELLPHIEHGASVDAPPRSERLDRLDEAVAAPAAPGPVR
ncbi:MAG TPA: MMPL family transporter [Jiangellales bacterium]|nr:MMPL family transporter [Jiangellales bacterium]